jgi:hypothetical protein
LAHHKRILKIWRLPRYKCIQCNHRNI